jgi:hypothetical protein
MFLSSLDSAVVAQETTSEALVFFIVDGAGLTGTIKVDQFLAKRVAPLPPQAIATPIGSEDAATQRQGKAQQESG